MSSPSLLPVMNGCNKRWDSSGHEQDKSKTWLVVRSICHKVQLELRG